VTYILWNLGSPASLLIIGLIMAAVAIGFLIASAARRRHDYRQLACLPGPMLIRYLVSTPSLPPGIVTGRQMSLPHDTITRNPDH
jgi:hypothetical protein